MHRNRVIRPAAVVAASLIAGSTMVACGSGETVTDTPETQTPAESSTTEAPATTSPDDTTTTSATSSETAETESSTRSSTSTSSSATTTRNSTASERRSARDKQAEEMVTKVQDKFGSLAPASLFDAFETCQETGLKGSYDCSGPEVGQFQFFDSTTKAASTTQLLTELRSSRVVEDTGRMVVGWSTLGTTAVITVVDNDEGLVLQQMVSSDQEDPEEKIYELGLAEPAASSETDQASSEDEAQVDTV